MNRKRYTAFIVFSGSENRRAWRFFCRRGWRHVTLILPVYDPYPSLSAKEYANVLHFMTDHCRSDVIFRPARSIAKDMLDEGATCAIAYPVDQKFTGRYVARGLFTCVSMVKAFLSINSWCTLTPYDLGRWLVRHGGTLLERRANDNDGTILETESGQEGAGERAGSAAPAGSAVAEADGRGSRRTRRPASAGGSEG